MGVADAGRQGVEADCLPAGDTFAGRRVCFHSTVTGSADNVPALQELGDSCRRLRGSHSMDVQVSLCMQCENHSECSAKVAEVVKCLVPHLCGMWVQPNTLAFSLQPLLPAAAQLERLGAIETDSETFSLLGHFPMLKELSVHVQHLRQLTAPLPQLHTLQLLFWGALLRQDILQCLVCHAPALRRLVLGCESEWPHFTYRPSPPGLQRWDIQALVGLQCQQLDFLTVQTDIIDEHTVTLLACIQCPLQLWIDVSDLSLLRSGPLLTLLARLPNLVGIALDNIATASSALWDQRGACLPYVRWLQLSSLPLDMNDSHMPFQSILTMFPALKHLALHSDPPLSLAARPGVHAHLWDAFKTCASQLVSLAVR